MVQTRPEVSYLFDNMDWFRTILEADLSSYDYIVLDLASLSERPDGTVNPFAAAAACDALILVCERGRITRQKLKSTVDMARVTGSRPFGLIMTQGDYIPVGEEIARSGRKLFFFAPWLARWIGRKARASEILG
jgi:Mrp family chromosome partitioning ATPase